jgi:magnesium-transporting ATPase (P-type)
MILVLVAAAVVTAVIGEVEDTGVILAIVVPNAAVGFVQGSRAGLVLAASTVAFTAVETETWRRRRTPA